MFVEEDRQVVKFAFFYFYDSTVYFLLVLRAGVVARMGVPGVVGVVGEGDEKESGWF